MVIDTHTHLYLKEFAADIDDVINRAKNLKINNFFLPAIDSSHTESMISLKNAYPEIMHMMAGLHPCSVKDNYLDELSHVENVLKNHPVVAIGEIGIDLYWDKSTLNIQKKAFASQIRLAKDLNLPIVIHCRNAFDEIFEVLEKEKSEKLRGIFHCFSGNYEQALKAISFNMKLGIGGVVTFKNGKIDKFLKKIPLDNLVLETDSPYLAPPPFRGKRNESSYLSIIIDKLTEVYEIPAEKIIEITSSNAIELFKIKV
ncbi:TatD family hydrolase [Flavobacteriaceae bacterium]|nr:TatD family hydrolase [Flavobacteriales bacterium]MDA9550443.1 TatD family hydrolase [Flavobacteriaceae bacterium]MDA9849683.1 TatD family hydrolase [Flavobacteriaceae bacterium]MDB2599447.1 TatD family hydrolase [Flavobacteriaceae bacterium]